MPPPTTRTQKDSTAFHNILPCIILPSAPPPPHPLPHHHILWSPLLEYRQNRVHVLCYNRLFNCRTVCTDTCYPFVEFPMNSFVITVYLKTLLWRFLLAQRAELYLFTLMYFTISKLLLDGFGTIGFKFSLLLLTISVSCNIDTA